MIAFTKRYPRPVDEPCQCCQMEQPDDYEITAQCPCEVLSELEEQLDYREPQQSTERWLHLVTATLWIVLAVVCHLVGLSCLPSLWAWWWFLSAFSSACLAGMAIAWAIRGD